MLNTRRALVLALRVLSFHHHKTFSVLCYDLDKRKLWLRNQSQRARLLLARLASYRNLPPRLPTVFPLSLSFLRCGFVLWCTAGREPRLLARTPPLCLGWHPFAYRTAMGATVSSVLELLRCCMYACVVILRWPLIFGFYRGKNSKRLIGIEVI